MKEKNIIDRLKEYSRSDFYPFHMPGHKRQIENGVGLEFPNPFSIDITEIDGFDNLHHAEGILSESMEWAASIYGADKTFYLVNGSSCGILSAISGIISNGGKILVGRNCHKSVYNGIFLNQLESEYIYPQFIDNFGITGGLSANDVDNLLDKNPDIRAVLVVSPTYEGIVSNIEAIAVAAHIHNVPLIVDEAHGAHFAFGKGLPVSALELGADVVIQSVHKTLPSMTQTALLHVKEGLVDLDRIEQYIHIYQSSSPSYVLMASIERCIDWMNTKGREQMERYLSSLEKAREQLRSMKNLKLLDRDLISSASIYDLDITKIVISSRGTSIDGVKLDDILRKNYHLEMEMCGPESVVALTSLMDTEEGMDRLVKALLEIDAGLTSEKVSDTRIRPVYPKIKFKISDALETIGEPVEWEEALGRVAAEFVYIYPPGIPLIAPGEVLEKDLIEKIYDYKKKGLSVQGLKDESLETIRVVPANVMRKMIWEKYFM